MTIVDSNVWVALFYADDSQHDTARHELAKAPRPLVITEYVVGEVCTVLASRAGKKFALSALEHFATSDGVELLFFGREVSQATIEAFRMYPRRDLSFIDCSLLMLSARHAVLTFDTALQRAIRRKTQKQ
jgi:predicted nucleic acid-binding protein